MPRRGLFWLIVVAPALGVVLIRACDPERGHAHSRERHKESALADGIESPGYTMDSGGTVSVQRESAESGTTQEQFTKEYDRVLASEEYRNLVLDNELRGHQLAHNPAGTRLQAARNRLLEAGGAVGAPSYSQMSALGAMALGEVESLLHAHADSCDLSVRTAVSQLTQRFDGGEYEVAVLFAPEAVAEFCHGLEIEFSMPTHRDLVAALREARDEYVIERARIREQLEIARIATVLAMKRLRFQGTQAEAISAAMDWNPALTELSAELRSAGNSYYAAIAGAVIREFPAGD